MKKNLLGFKQAFRYILDLLCYAYYVQHDNLVSDQTFDELEKLYCKLFNKETAPMRSMEREEQYGYGIKFLYHEVYKKGYRGEK